MVFLQSPSILFEACERAFWPLSGIRILYPGLKLVEGKPTAAELTHSPAIKQVGLEELAFEEGESNSNKGIESKAEGEDVEQAEDCKEDKRIGDFGDHPGYAAHFDFVVAIEVAVFKCKVEPHPTGVPRHDPPAEILGEDIEGNDGGD